MPPVNRGNGEQADSSPEGSNLSSLPEGVINRGVIMVGGVDAPGSNPSADERARREERNRRDRERRRRDREAREAATRLGEAAAAAAGSAPGAATARGTVSYHDSRAPHVTIHGPTYEGPTYEGPSYHNNPIQVQSPDIQVGGAGGGNGGGEGGGRRPDDDPGRDDEEMRQLRDQLDRLNSRVDQLENGKQQLQTRVDELEHTIEERDQRIRELEEENERLRHPPLPEGPTPQELEQAMINLETARDELARVDLRRSARITDRFLRRRREDAAAYETALNNYNQALEACARLIIAHERAQGTEDQAIHRAIIQMKYGEDARYAERIVEINDDNFKNLHGWRRTLGNGLRRYANLSTRTKILIGVASLGVGVVSVMTGAGLAILVAGSAARVSLGLVGHQASLRNNIRRNDLERQLRQIQEAQREAEGNLGTGNLEVRGRELASQTGEERSGRTRENMRRNRRGTYVMAGGLALTGVGLAHLGGVDVIPDTGWLHPHINWPNIHIPGIHNPFGGHSHNGLKPTHTGGGPGFGPATGGGAHHEVLKHLPDNFQMDTIHAHNTTDFVQHTFGHKGLLERQGIHADGLTTEKARHLAEYLQNHHWKVVEGMQAGGHGGLEQHVVDAANWKDGIHNPSHAEAWTSKEELQRAMKIAHDKFGINFRVEGR